MIKFRFRNKWGCTNSWGCAISCTYLVLNYETSFHGRDLPCQHTHSNCCITWLFFYMKVCQRVFFFLCSPKVSSFGRYWKIKQVYIYPSSGHKAPFFSCLSSSLLLPSISLAFQSLLLPLLLCPQLFWLQFVVVISFASFP